MRPRADLFHWTYQKNCVTNVLTILFGVCVTNVTSCDLLIHSNSIHGIQKISKIRNWKARVRWKVIQKFQLFNVQILKDRENDLIKRKVWRKIKIKGLQNKKLIDTQCESNINTVPEEIASSENIALGYCCQW